MNAIVNGEIIIEKKNRAEIITQLVEKGFHSNPMKMKNAAVRLMSLFLGNYLMQIDIHRKGNCLLS